MPARRSPIPPIVFCVLAASAVFAEGEPCTDDAQCERDEYCLFLDGSCLSDEPVGVCRFVPPDAGCPAVYIPVCGCDLQTYSNGCFADVAHVSILYPGECQTCGGAAAPCELDRICLVPEDGCTEDYTGVCIPPRDRETRTFAFEGTIDTLFDGLGLFGPGVGPGDRFHGSLTYDLTTPDSGGVGEGTFGVYLHESAPAGVRLIVGERTVRSVYHQPGLTVFVNDEVGFAGADEFGFESGNSELADPWFSPRTLAIELDWRLSEFFENPITSVDLPVCPVEPALFENNDMRLFMECVPCVGPAAFVDLTGSVDVFESDLVLRVDRDALHWSSPQHAVGFDVLTGELSGLGDFAAATTGCLADDLSATSLALDQDPASGEGRWFLLRPERVQGAGSWDSSGLRQQRPRDSGIEASGVACR